MNQLFPKTHTKRTFPQGPKKTTSSPPPASGSSGSGPESYYRRGWNASSNHPPPPSPSALGRKQTIQGNTHHHKYGVITKRCNLLNTYPASLLENSPQSAHHYLPTLGYSRYSGTCIVLDKSRPLGPNSRNDCKYPSCRPLSCEFSKE